MNSTFIHRRGWLSLTSGLGAGLTQAQVWPSKAIRFVVPFARAEVKPD